MKKLLVGALIGAVAMSGLVRTGPAHAAPAAFAIAVQGSGAIDPALTFPPGPISHHTWDWTGAATVVGVQGTVIAGVSDCHAQGAGTVPDTIATAAGQGAWFCWGGPLDGYSGQLVYARVGLYLHIVVVGALNGTLGCVIEYVHSPGDVFDDFTITCGGYAAGL